MDKNETKKNVFEEVVNFSKEEWDKAIDTAYDKIKKDIKMDGFRKGNVPKDLYYKKVGKDSLYRDALDVILPKAYQEALTRGNYEPIIEPRVDILQLDENGVSLKFVITTRPEVTIKKYTGLNISKKDNSVSQEEVDNEIKKMLERYSELILKEEGVVEDKNVAIIDFEGFKDGVAFEGGKGENYPLEIGSGTFIPGFEEQLIGMKKGEEKEIKVTFPENYQAEDLKGKEVTFKVKVNEIKERQARTLDKEFFEDLAMEGVSTKEELEKEIKANLEANKTSENENALIDEILKKIADETTVEIPEEMIHEEIHHMLQHFEEQMRMQGISMDVYYEITKSKPEDLEEQMRPEARNHILYRFIIDTIKDKENIKVEKEEIEQEIKEQSKKYNMQEEEFVKMYGSKEIIGYELEIRKVFDFLKEKNVK